jgi:tetratricopeptide (TPR) repeat protein
MIKQYNKKCSLIVSLFAAAILLFFFIAGCQEQTRTTNEKSTVANNIISQDSQNLEDRPPTSKTLFAMADILATQGRDKECEFILKRIIQEYPRFLPAYNSLAELQIRQGKIHNAVETINDAFRINPNDSLLQNNLGVCWIILGQYQKALDFFTKAASAKPENMRYRMNMAVALGLMGRYEESLSLFRQVLPEEEANQNLNTLREHGKQVDNVSDVRKSI